MGIRPGENTGKVHIFGQPPIFFRLWRANLRSWNNKGGGLLEGGFLIGSRLMQSYSVIRSVSFVISRAVAVSAFRLGIESKKSNLL